METRIPPSKIARFADFGIGLESCTMASDGCSREEESPTVGLALELGSGSGHRPSSCKTKACGFTFFQLQELQLQSLIYKYMEAGLPVPYHLVIPIWKSVSNSFTGLSGGIHQLYPSFLGSAHLEFRNGLDPEPGRCRRTDGKKWRCSKEAISDHKYCERHVNRGRHRSRKLVEASPATTIASTANANANTNTNTNLSISLSFPVVNSSSSTGSSSLSASPSFGFSPRSVLHGGTQSMNPL